MEPQQTFTLSIEGGLLILTQHHVPSMCPEFDPNPGGEYWWEARILNLSTNKVQVLDWRSLKIVYNLNKDGWLRDQKITVWNVCRDMTPYQKLSRRQQINHDRLNGTYPNPSSKYFNDIPESEIEELICDLKLNVGQNINDARMYNDPPYQHSRHYDRTIRTIRDLEAALAQKN